MLSAGLTCVIESEQSVHLHIDSEEVQQELGIDVALGTMYIAEQSRETMSAEQAHKATDVSLTSPLGTAFSCSEVMTQQPTCGDIIGTRSGNEFFQGGDVAEG